MNKIKKIFVLVMINIFLFLLIICTYILANNFFDYRESEKITEKLTEHVIEIDDYSKIDNNINIKWEYLEKINKDIIGWIKIDDTNIDYPILKDDNLYYINHTFENKYNRNGSIFTITNNPFKVQETVLYGHNNKNNIMFSEIEKFMKKDFFYDHQSFKIYTKEKNYDAKIFSIYSIGVYEENSNIKNLTFDERIEYYKNQSNFKNYEQEMPMKIIKLSTCSYLNNKERPTNQRYYLLAYLIEDN